MRGVVVEFSLRPPSPQRSEERAVQRWLRELQPRTRRRLVELIEAIANAELRAARERQQRRLTGRSLQPDGQAS